MFFEAFLVFVLQIGATEGSQFVNISNLVLPYAGEYRMRIFDFLEIQQSQDLMGYNMTVFPGNTKS